MIVVGGWPGRKVVGLNGRFGVRLSELATGSADPNPFANNFDSGDPAATEMVVVVTSLPSSGVVSLGDDGAFSHTGAADGIYHTLGTVYSWAPGGPLVQSAQVEDIESTVGASFQTGHLIFNAGQPSVTVMVTITSGVGHLVYQGKQGQVTQAAGVVPGVGHLVYQGKICAVDQQPLVVGVSPVTGHLVYQGSTPMVAVPIVIVAGSGHLAFSGHPAVIRQGTGSMPSTIAAGRIYRIVPDGAQPTWMATARAAQFTLDKDPQATLDYGFDWSNWEAAVPDDPITSFDIAGNAELVVLSQALVAGIYAAMVTGGFEGAKAELVCSVETQQGRRDERTIVLNVANR